MIAYSHIDRGTHSSCSIRKSESRKKPAIVPLPGFLPTSAESIRLALSLSLHGMPHDRVFGVYKEGYYTLINTYLWDLCRFNHLIESFKEYLTIAPISLESFSTGLVSFIKISDAFYALMEFLIRNDNQDLYDSVYGLYKERCAEQDANLYPYELHVREVSQRYIACIDLELREGLIKQRNRYKVAYTRLLEMYSEDIAATNRILGNIGAQFISDRNIVGSTGISPTILTSRLLAFIRSPVLHNNDISPSLTSVPPTLDFRSFDDAFQGASSQSPVPRKYQSPALRALSMHRERGNSVRSSTSYVTRRNYMDSESQSLYNDPIQHKNSMFNIRAELMDVMSSMDAQMYSSPQLQQRQQYRGNQRSSATGFIIRDGVSHEAQSLHEKSSIAEVHGVDIGLQAEVDSSVTTIDAIVWTISVTTSDQMVTTDAPSQIDVQTQTEVATVARTEVELQTEVKAQVETDMQTDSKADTVTICSIHDLNTALQNKIGFNDSITLAYTFLESLLGQIQATERYYISEKDIEENGSTTAETVDATVQTISSGRDDQRSNSSSNDRARQLQSIKDPDNNKIITSQLPTVHSINKYIQSQQDQPREHQKEMCAPNREEPLTENEILWKQRFDPYLARVSFVQGFSQEISDCESSLQPIFDLCDQSSITVSTDGVVGTAILSISRSFPEFIYDAPTSNSSECYTPQSQPPVLSYVEDTTQPKQLDGELTAAEAAENRHARYTSRVHKERSYEALYNNILSKYMLMEEQSLKRTLEAEELQARVDMLTEEAESLRVELQRAKDQYMNDILNSYGMIVQGSVSENDDLSKGRYTADNKIAKVEGHCRPPEHEPKETGLFLSTSISDSEKPPADSDLYVSTSGQIVCSVIRNDVAAGLQDDILAESVIAMHPQSKIQANTPEEGKNPLTMYENTLLLQQLNALERNEKVLLAELNKVSAESQAKTELNRNMQSMLSTIGLTVSNQLSDMEQLSTLVDSIERNTFSLRPEIRKLQSYLAKTASPLSRQSPSASFIDCLDD